MRAADTSLVIAAFASWHEAHDVARRALDGGLRLVDHCALESYSVLTRLPPPHRAPGGAIRDLPDRQVTGGAAYDALVAATASANGAELLTCDRRAVPVYERYGIRARLLLGG